MVPAEHYVEQLWAALDQTLRYSKCGIGSDTPVGEGGTLDLNTCTIVGATAPSKPFILAPGVPPPPEYLPEMKDDLIVKEHYSEHSHLGSLLSMVPLGQGNPLCSHLRSHIGRNMQKGCNQA